KKSRNFIRRAHKTNPDARIIVTGCYAELRREEIEKIEGVWRVYGASEKSKILEDNTESYIFGAYSTGERTRSFLKVQDGCNNFCAYCTVPYARGRSRNIPICECVKMAREIAAAGVKEVVLTGVNTGDFGRTTGESFLDLLKALNEVEGIERFRISSIEPNLITPEIVDWIAGGTKFQPHFHIPLQSGSDTLLRRVGRRYDTALFASRIDYIRKTMERPGGPKVFFGIDVIVGLPGETEELFQETYSFLKERIKPAFIHVFPYSRRPGTKAAEWKDQVKDSVKAQRVAALEELCDQLHAEFVSANKGIREKVLWESSVKGGLMGGYTGNYIRLEKPFDAALVNTLEEIEI
ncbi:MAG: MiaB/RimO family radical SAM methylthiotransferase, partial [Bacteroidales bacterium]|nr:MiaB/RimO family radical SAM methylthiotransferase [Bacteroidales bacterium]